MSIDFPVIPGLSPDEVKQRRIDASNSERAIAAHRRGDITLVDEGVSWSGYCQGHFLTTMAWEGGKGQPKNVPSAPKDTYLQNAKCVAELGVTATERQLRGEEPIRLSVAQMVLASNLEAAALSLPQNFQFDKTDYQRLRAALLKAGATYKRSAFHFPSVERAEEVISQLLQGERVNFKKSLQYYPTPEPVADRLFQGVDVSGKVVLEPSGGEGALVEQALKRGADRVLTAELHTDFHQTLRQKGAEVIGDDLLALTAEDVKDVDVVIMNPPFTKGQDVDHVNHLLEILPPTAEIHAIMSGSIRHHSQSKYERFRDYLSEVGSVPEVIEKGAFQSSGTQVETCLVRIPSRAMMQMPDVESEDQPRPGLGLLV